MTVLNDIDRFHLVNDAYIRQYGEDMPEIRDWQWEARGATARPAATKGR